MVDSTLQKPHLHDSSDFDEVPHIENQTEQRQADPRIVGNPRARSHAAAAMTAIYVRYSASLSSNSWLRGPDQHIKTFTCMAPSLLKRQLQASTDFRVLAAPL